MDGRDCARGACDHEVWTAKDETTYVDRRRTNFHGVATKYYLREDGTIRVAMLTPKGQRTIEVSADGSRVELVPAEHRHNA